MRDRLPSLPNPRIRHGVQDIGEEVYRHVGQADGEDAALHQVVVAVGDGLDREASDAGPRKDRFGHDGTSE